MSSPASAPRAATETAASPLLSPARAAASRINGAKSRGPKTPEGKARSAQNALKHGLRAQKCIVLPGERASAFEAFEAALLEELAPQGALQAVLAQRVVAASWRLARAERLEAELFAREMHSPCGDRGLGLALIRDCNGARAFDTLLRYRGGTLAELWRALRTLKALQADQAARPQPETDLRDPAPDPSPESPIKPNARANAGDSRADAASTPATSPVPDPAAASAEPAPALDAAANRAPAARTAAPGDRAPASSDMPIEPNGRTNPGEATGFDARGPAARAA
jgi:hypothetical protein